MDTAEEIFGRDAASFSAAPSVSSSDPMGSALDERAEAGRVQQVREMSSVASFVMANWRTNVDARRESRVDEKLDHALKAYTLTYTDDQKAKMAAAGIDPRVFSPVTFTKARSAKAMLVELVNASEDPLFMFEPTPDPEVPEEVMDEALKRSLSDIQDTMAQLAQAGVESVPPEAQQKLQLAMESALAGGYETRRNAADDWARKRAKRLQRKVWDIMCEGGWKDAFFQYLDDVCVFGTGVIVGPVMRTVPVNKVVANGRTKVRRYVRSYESKPTFEAVSPIDCYPAPDAEDVGDGPLCIRTRFTAPDLWCFSSAKTAKQKDGGWIQDAVTRLLAEHPNGGVHIADDWTAPDRRNEQNKNPEDTNDCTFEGVRCFAPFRGSMLAEMGFSKLPDGRTVDLRAYYRGEAIVIDGLVVYFRVYDERMGVPICKGKFYELPGSWWGESVADKLFMCQFLQNNAVKALLRNLAIAGGAQFWIGDASRLMNKQDIGWRPFRTWMFGQSMTGNQGAPMGVVDVPFKGSEIMGVFREFRTQADIDSGIPAFTEGQSAAQGGALRTSSGLAMYTEATNRGMKMVVFTSDRLVICPGARMVADWVLINDEDMDIKGDVDVKPVGLIGRILKAQRDQSRQQLLSMILNSQYLQQLVGPKGVMAVFRPSVKDVDINPDDVMPNEDRVKEIEYLDGIKQILGAMQGAQPGGGQDGEMAGSPPGVAQPAQVEQPQGGVAERRSVA